MNSLIKLRTILFSCVIVSAAICAYAQKPVAQRSETLLIKNEQSVLDGIGLTEAEKTALLPLHHEYQQCMSQIRRFNNTFYDQLNAKSDLLDDEAWTKLDEFVALQKQKFNLQKRYAAKFRKIIPPKKAAKYFLLENKLDTIIDDPTISGYHSKME